GSPSTPYTLLARPVAGPKQESPGRNLALREGRGFRPGHSHARGNEPRATPIEQATCQADRNVQLVTEFVARPPIGALAVNLRGRSATRSGPLRAAQHDAVLRPSVTKFGGALGLSSVHAFLVHPLGGRARSAGHRRGSRAAGVRLRGQP